MSNKRIQKLKAILRNSRGKRHENRFKCHLCKVIYDRGWEYIFDGETYLFCEFCKQKLKPGKMLHKFIIKGDFESNK